MKQFQSHNGFARTFLKNKYTLGISFPFENYADDLLTMDLEKNDVSKAN